MDRGERLPAEKRSLLKMRVSLSILVPAGFLRERLFPFDRYSRSYPLQGAGHQPMFVRICPMHALPHINDTVSLLE
jgi:hypothetical protein